MLHGVALGVSILCMGCCSFLAVAQFFDATTGSPMNLATVCEIELRKERCRMRPEFGPARASRVFFDTWDNSDKSRDRCMRRAAEFAAFCGSTEPVTARFFHGSQLVSSETWRR